MWVTWLPDNASHSGNLLPPYLRKSTFTSCALHACRKKYMHVVCIIYKTECFTFLHDGKGGMKIYSPEKNHKGIARKWEYIFISPKHLCNKFILPNNKR